MKGHLYRPITQLPPSLSLSLYGTHNTCFFLLHLLFFIWILLWRWHKVSSQCEISGFIVNKLVDFVIDILDIYSLSWLYYLEKIWQLISLQFNFLLKSFQPQVTHWQSPYMHAYFPALNSFPSLLGDMLADAIGCLGFTWVITSLNFWLLYSTTCCQFLI